MKNGNEQMEALKSGKVAKGLGDVGCPISDFGFRM
jgi:hypothetical protein